MYASLLMFSTVFYVFLVFSDFSFLFFVCFFFFFFFQAEDGIRDDLVTGVQTCALPIYRRIAHQSVVRVQGDAKFLLIENLKRMLRQTGGCARMNVAEQADFQWNPLI